MKLLKAQPLKVYYSIDSVNGAKHKKKQIKNNKAKKF